MKSGHKNYAGHWRSIRVITQILHDFFNKIENAQQAEPIVVIIIIITLIGATNKIISIFGLGDLSRFFQNLFLSF